MPDVGTTFGNGVNDATQSAAVLGLEAAGLDLYFLDEIGLEVLADAAVLNVGGVDAIDQVNILTVACAVDLETPGAARCTTLHRLLSRARSKRNYGLERASLRNICQLILGNRHRDLTLSHVHGRRLGPNFHDFAGGTHFQLDVDVWQAAHIERNAFVLHDAKALRGDRQRIGARRKTGKPVKTSGIGFRFLRT